MGDGQAMAMQQVPGIMGQHMMGQQPATTMEIDERASVLLHALPYDTQMDITRKLEDAINKGQVMNPSAWVAKACLRRSNCTTQAKVLSVRRRTEYYVALKCIRASPDAPSN